MAMINPYELIDRRLSAIESLLQEMRNQRINTHCNTSDTPAPIISANEVKKMTGWPNGTFYAKVAQMPKGVVIRKSKRLLFDREQLIVWLKTPVKL